MSAAEQTDRPCNGCKKELEKRGEKPRRLYKLPTEVTRREFKRKTLAVYLCESCDGGCIDNAVAEHYRRTDHF